MLEAYSGKVQSRGNRAGSLDPRMHRGNRQVGRPSDFMGGDNDIFGQLMNMQSQAMRQFDDMMGKMLDFGFQSK